MQSLLLFDTFYSQNVFMQFTFVAQCFLLSVFYISSVPILRVQAYPALAFRGCMGLGQGGGCLRPVTLKLLMVLKSNFIG